MNWRFYRVYLSRYLVMEKAFWMRNKEYHYSVMIFLGVMEAEYCIILIVNISH